MKLPKKWEAIASDPAHFGDNRREAVERCYQLHTAPPRELSDAEIAAIFRKYNWSDGDPELMKTTRDIIAAHERKQRDPETVTLTLRTYRKPDGCFETLTDSYPGNEMWSLVHTQTIDVVEPTEAMWGGLARDIMFVLRQERPTPKKLFYHLTQLGHTLPNWMADETELRDPASDHVISKGTCCALIYKAMLTAAKGE